METAAQLGKAVYPARDSSGGLALYKRAQQWLPSPSTLFRHPIPVSQAVGDIDLTHVPSSGGPLSLS